MQCIIEVFASGPFNTNTILLGCAKTKKAAVIDVPFDSVEKMVKRIHHHSLAVEKILLTHSHWDHIAEAAALKKNLNVPLYVHVADKDNLEHPGADGLPLLFPFEAAKPDRYVQDGDQVSVGMLEITVIHTPGHTPGSVCYYLAQEKLLISGDTLFRGTIGNVNYPQSRPDLMGDSLKKLAALPPETKVIPGHGESTSIGAESWLADAPKRFGLHKSIRKL
ncbi:MAG: MBL fold metallo-hydrolase [Chlamydiales bacterium]